MTFHSLDTSHDSIKNISDMKACKGMRAQKGESKIYQETDGGGSGVFIFQILSQADAVSSARLLSVESGS